MPRVLLLLLYLTANLTAAEPTLLVGAFAIDVTPEQFPVSVNGGFQDRKATTANDRLHARCLVLDDGQTQLALVVVDSCMLPRELLDEAKKRASQATGIPPSHMLISATHTHTAPTSTGVFGSDTQENYVPFLTQKIAEGITKAHANRSASELGYAVVQEPRELFNRRWWIKPGVQNLDPFGNTTDLVRMNPGHQNPALIAPAGPIDPDVTVLSARTPTGQPKALFATYSLHYVGGLPALSADYFGIFSDTIGGKIGATGSFVGGLFNGTSGDVNNVNFSQPALKAAPGERCRVVADVVSTAAKKAYEQAKHTGRLTLAAAETELEFRVRKPQADELKRAEFILAKLDSRAPQTAEEVYARESLLLAKYPDTVKLKVQALRIGGLGVVGIPCETFTEIGLEIKRRSPLQPTVVISLANGYNGYLPTPHHHKLGGYETWRARSSYLEINASEGITATALKLLNAVK